MAHEFTARSLTNQYSPLNNYFRLRPGGAQPIFVGCYAAHSPRGEIPGVLIGRCAAGQRLYLSFKIYYVILFLNPRNWYYQHY